MKILFKAILLLSIVWSASSGWAGVPQPAVVIYGIVRDAYGCPYGDHADVLAYQDDRDCARSGVTRLLPGAANYRLNVEIDSGGSLYAAYAVHVGDALNLRVNAGGSDLTPIAHDAITVPFAGSRTRLDLITGTDSDADGLPDEWEQQLIDQSGGLLITLLDVDPKADFDGDGMSNQEEFQAGTFAFLPTDVLAVQNMAFSEDGGRILLRFLTSPSRTYHLFAVTELDDASTWHPVAFAFDAQSDCVYQSVMGDGAYQTFYVERVPEECAMFFRLGVE